MPHHNLDNVTASIPLGTFTCITGVSGSGKSSFTIDTLKALLANDVSEIEKRADADDKTQGIGDAELMDILDRDKVFSDWDFEVNKPSSSPMAIPNEGEMYDIIVTDDGKGGLMGGLS